MNFVFQIDIVDIKYTETKAKIVPKKPKVSYGKARDRQNKDVALSARQAKIGGAPLVRFSLRISWYLEGPEDLPAFKKKSIKLDGCLLTYEKKTNTIYWTAPRVNWGFGPRNVIHCNDELNAAVIEALREEGVYDAFAKQVMAYDKKVQELNAAESGIPKLEDLGSVLDGTE